MDKCCMICYFCKVEDLYCKRRCVKHNQMIDSMEINKRVCEYFKPRTRYLEMMLEEKGKKGT